MNNNSNISKRTFYTRKITTLALFTALSYVVSYFSFPIFPATPYLKLDFGNVFILLSALLFGPVEGIIVCLLKETLALFNSTTVVGELANLLMTSSFILLPSVVYRYKKGFKTVVCSLLGACLIGTVAATLINRFIVFPLYMGGAAQAVFNDVFLLVMAFNLIKTASISILTVLLYKRLSGLLKKLELR